MNNIIELILFILGFLLVKHVERNMPDVEEDHPLVKSKPMIEIYVEKIQNIYYAWEDNKNFLFQHTDANEMARMLIKKYPGKELKINEVVVS